MNNSGPFLTIVTRCCKRPTLLARCIESVRVQTCKDVEQLFIVDNEQRGLKWANAQFEAHKDKPAGRFVFHLDDDGRLSDPRFVGRVKAMAEAKPWADVLLVKAYQTDLRRMLPPADVWGINWEQGERPSKWIGSGYNYVTVAELWRANVWRYHRGQGKEWQTGGDWKFMSGLIELGASVARVDVVAAMGRRRRAREFERCGPDWFATVARRYGIEYLTGDVWRLQHG